METNQYQVYQTIHNNQEKILKKIDILKKMGYNGSDEERRQH